MGRCLLELPETLDDCGKQRESDDLLEILDNLEILETLEIPPARRSSSVMTRGPLSRWPLLPVPGHVNFASNTFMAAPQLAF